MELNAFAAVRSASWKNNIIIIIIIIIIIVNFIIIVQRIAECIVTINVMYT